MRLFKLSLVTALTAIFLATPQMVKPAQAGKTRDAIAAGLIGAAIIAAASKHHRHQQKYYYDGYEPYPPEDYGNRWNNAYSPAAGITCYYVQNACYKANGHYSARWTRQQFASGAQ